MFKKLLTHVAIHLDEIFAIFLLRKYGEAKFPGVTTSELCPVAGDPRGDDNSFDADGVIPVGCGGGRFDEHRPNGRVAGECAATLVAKHLGIQDKPGVAELLEEVLRCDTKPGVHSFQIAEIIKTANRCFLGWEGAAVKFADGAIPVIISQLTYPLPSRNGTEKGVGDLLDEWLRDGLEVGEKTQLYLRRLAKESAEQGQITGLDFIVRAMQRQGKPLKEIREWIDFAFSRLAQDQAEFLRMVDEIKPDDTGRGKCSREYEFNTSDGRRTKKIRALVVQSDDRRAGRAALYLRPQIHIIRKSNGQTQIFCNKGSGLGSDEIGDIVAHLRFWEGGKEAGLTWVQLRESGRVECSPPWYYFAEAGQILNGSDSHPNVPATKLTIDSIVNAVRRALDFPALQRWQKEVGVKIEAKGSKPIATVGEMASHKTARNKDTMRELEHAFDKK